MKSEDPPSAEVTSEVTGIAVDGDDGGDDPFAEHCFSSAPPGPLHVLMHFFRHFFLHFLSFLGFESPCFSEHVFLHSTVS